MNIRFTKYSPIYYIFSGILIIASVAALFGYGLKFGIEFTGGSIIEGNFQQRPANEAISKVLSDLKVGDSVIQPVNQNSIVIRLKGIDETTHQDIIAKLGDLSKFEEKSFQYIGPSIGNELKNKTGLALVLSLIIITLYIALAFRKVSMPVSSWKYSITSSVALFHDILIPVGVFSYLGIFIMWK